MLKDDDLLARSVELNLTTATKAESAYNTPRSDEQDTSDEKECEKKLNVKVKEARNKRSARATPKNKQGVYVAGPEAIRAHPTATVSQTPASTAIQTERRGLAPPRSSKTNRLVSSAGVNCERASLRGVSGHNQCLREKTRTHLHMYEFPPVRVFMQAYLLILYEHPRFHCTCLPCSFGQVYRMGRNIGSLCIGSNGTF